MASNVPVTKFFSWTSLIPQLILIALLCYTFYILDFDDPFVFGALTYCLLAFILRNAIATDHRRGIRLVKQKKFADAIPLFEKSVDYFTKNAWVDKYRFLTLLSSSRATYKEMGLCNIAFCFGQTGNGQKAKEYYERTIQEFPDNGLAIAGLNMLNSVGLQSERTT